MKSFLTAFVSILIILIFSLSGANAQVVEEQLEEPPLKNTYWLMLGLGGSSLGAFDATAFDLTGAAAYRRGKQYISLRSVWNSRLDKQQTYYDAGLIYGNVLGESDVFVAAVGTGVSMVGGQRQNDAGDIEDFDPVLGLPIEAQFRWRIRENVGAGLYLFGNINSRVNFYGAAASVYFGKFQRN